MPFTGFVRALERPFLMVGLIIWCSVLLHIQVCSCLVDGSSPDWVSGQKQLLMSYSMLIPAYRGAQIVFRSFLQPVFSRYFSQSGSTAAKLRSQADQATKPHAL